MPFNPLSPLALNHKLYRARASQVVVQNTIEVPISVIPMASVSASWLSVSMSSIVDSKTFRWLFSLKAAVDSLPPGSYSATVEFKHSYQVDLTVFNVTETYKVNLTVTATIKLAASRSQFSFIYFEGQNPPASEYFNLVTENAWTATPDQSWIELNKTSGSGSSQIQLTADVAGLAVGEYSGQILFQDGYDQIFVNVQLSVRSEDTADDFLLVSPGTITFAEVQGEAPTSTKVITIESSEAFTLAKTVAWLQLSSASESAGTKSVTLSVINTEGLAAGNYNDVVTIASSFSSKTISIALLINSAEIEGVDLDEFYFSEDRDKITLLSNEPNTELVLEFDVQATNKAYAFKKRIPFFQGKASALLADYADSTVQHNDFFANTASRVFSPVTPLSVNIKAFNKDLYSTLQTLRESYTGVQALTGATPLVTDKLSHVPGTIYAPKNGFVSFTFRADTKPNDITFSGAATGSLAVGDVTGPVYTCFVNLSELTLVEGDILNIFCGAFLLKVIIKGLEPEITPIAWLNEWNCPEFYSCSGYLSIDNEDGKTVATYASEGKEVTRVLEVRRPRRYDLNTGFVFTRPEYEWLASILDARKVWILQNGIWEEVICTTRSMNVHATREFYKAYRLSFKSAAV